MCVNWPSVINTKFLGACDNQIGFDYMLHVIDCAIYCLNGNESMIRCRQLGFNGLVSRGQQFQFVVAHPGRQVQPNLLP